MAGQPKRRAMIEALEARTREYFEDDTEPSTLDYIASWIEEGNSILKLADELTAALGYTVYAQWIHAYLRKRYGDALDARLVESRARASHQLAEHALAITDEKADSSVDVARNGLRARARQWTAERWNAASYGQSKQATVAISFSQVHLDALKLLNAKVTPAVAVGANNTELTRGETSQPLAIASVMPDQA